MEEYYDDIAQEFQESILVKELTIKESPSIALAARHAVDCYNNEGKLILFGNGGSAADAQHLAAEMVNYLHNKKRRPVAAHALNANSSVITCIGNDHNFEQVFSQQIQAIAKPEDVMIAISTSGTSKNVVEGAKMAQSMGCKVIGLTGKHGGTLKDHSDVCIKVPSEKTTRIQEAHITIGHILCGLMEKELFD